MERTRGGRQTRDHPQISRIFAVQKQGEGLKMTGIDPDSPMIFTDRAIWGSPPSPFVMAGLMGYSLNDAATKLTGRMV